MAQQSEEAERIGKRSGAVQQEIFQKEEYQRQLQGILDRLSESVPGFKYDKRSLSQLLGGMQQFLEDAFGINALVRNTPKLPASVFEDFSPDGPLTIIATLCAEMMKTKGQKRMDWLNPGLRKENSDLVLRIRQELLRAGYIRTPRVFIQPSCPNEGVLRGRILKLGGEVVQKENAQGVTHVIYPFGESGDPDDGKEYLRTVAQRGGMAKVHWWYLPDSYNEWIPSGSVSGEVEVDQRPPGGRPWRLYLRWVYDSEKYNEWMNETDYETEESVAENKRAREAGEGDAEATREKKRARKDGKATAPVEVAPEVERVLGPGAIVRHVLVPNRKVMDVAGGTVDISQGQRQEWAGIPVAPAPAPAPAAAAAAAADPAAPATNGNDSAPKEAAVYLIPACSAWFKFGCVHEFERKEFTEFYDHSGGRSPEQYLEYRNYMITRFREDPSRAISFADIMRGLEGDGNDIRKVFDFLDRWGIINFTQRGAVGAVDMDRRDQPVGAAAIVRVRRAPTPREAAEAAAQGGSTRVTVRQGTFRRAAPQPPAIASGTRYFCNAYPNVDCTDLRYHCTKVPDVDLCPAAFAEGRFPPGCNGKDFIRVAAVDAVPDDSGWTDQETLLLLEGLELYGDNWAQISEHVRGKSQMECVQRLLSLPIEDTLLPKPGAGGVYLTPENGVVQEGDMLASEGGNGAPLPFADAGNPVMAQIAFLTTMVGPRVASAAAQRALEVLAEEDSGAAEAMPEQRVRAAAAAGLAAAAVKARLMADAEEREMQRMVLAACEVQMRRMEAKLKHLEEIDDVLKRETGNLKIYTANAVAEYGRMMEENEKEENAKQEAEGGDGGEAMDAEGGAQQQQQQPADTPMQEDPPAAAS